MAVTLAGSSDARISYGDVAAIAGLTALTVALTFNASSFAGFEYLASQTGDIAGEQAFLFRFENTDEIAFYVISGSAAFQGRRTSAKNFVTGTTYRVVAKWRASDQAQAIWVDGVSEALTDLLTQSPASIRNAPSNLTVGTSDHLADGIDGIFSEFALWGEYVPDWFCEAYGKGYSPAFYRSNGILYDPLINIDHLRDRWGGLSASNISGTSAAHPRVLYPSGLPHGGIPVAAEPPPDPPGPGFGAIGNFSNASVQVRLEQIYASVAGHTAPSIARDTHFLMSRIGLELGIDITSGMRSFETNLRILYKALTGNTYTGDIHSTELILRAIEADL